MKCFTIKKTYEDPEQTTEEILNNTVFSSDTEAIKALKADVEKCRNPLAAIIEYNEKLVVMRNTLSKTTWEVEEHIFNDGKLG